MSNEMIETYTTVNDKLYYVHHGYCDGRPTKWITLTPWDGCIKLQFIDGEVYYFDGNNKKILVYEDNEDEFYLF